MADGRATRGGRGWFPGFVTKQETATAAVASIEDAAECGERADALVSEVLGRVMRQRRSIAAALDCVKSSSRGTRANCWELAEAAGHETPHRMQAYNAHWPGGVGAVSDSPAAARQRCSKRRIAAGYKIWRRNGLIAAIYPVPSSPFGFTKMAIWPR